MQLKKEFFVRRPCGNKSCSRISIVASRATTVVHARTSLHGPDRHEITGLGFTLDFRGNRTCNAVRDATTVVPLKQVLLAPEQLLFRRENDLFVKNCKADDPLRL